MDFSKNIIEILVDGIKKSSWETVNYYVPTVYMLLLIKDSFLELRIKWLLGYP